MKDWKILISLSVETHVLIALLVDDKDPESSSDSGKPWSYSG